MARRRKYPAKPSIDRSHIVEDAESAGELVRIKGRQGTYRLSAEVRNTETGAEWVEMYGPLGKGGNPQFHAVRRHDVRRATKREAYRAGRRPNKRRQPAR